MIAGVNLDRTTRLILTGCVVASVTGIALSVSAVGVPRPNLEASDGISLVALAVSAVALGRPWWNERNASIEVRSEQYRRIIGERVSREQRYVVKNHGPAQAHDVQVTFFRDGQPVELHLSGWNHRAHTPLLHPGEELHMHPITTAEEGLPERVVVTWRDRRIGGQSQEYYPSTRDL